MTDRHASILGLLAVAVWLSCMAVVVAHAVEYRPDTREALLIRPQSPVERVKPSAPYLMSPERPKCVTWVVRDKDGTILIIGAQVVRQRC